MADLDDFFAKRDKKKKTKKFTSSEELAKQLENSIKEKEAKAKAARQNTNPTIPEENPDGTNVVEVIKNELINQQLFLIHYIILER